jgi:hypothetical protein
MAPRVDRLIGLLAEAVGEPAAKAAVRAAATWCGIDLASLNADEELVILRRIAESPGLIGITAQLLGARVRLENIRRRPQHTPR